jgi:hypothetical protein
MKKTISLCAAVFVLAGFSNAVKAQSVTTPIGAKIVEAITLTETSPMQFGVMTVPTTPATVILDVTGSRTNTGTISLLAQLPAAAAAAYTVTGANDATYAITLPTTTIIADGIPAHNMNVNTFTCSYGGLVGTIGFSGSDFFSIGATLNLADAQPAGEYAGVFDVSVAYN